jgi:hypothetical protein
VNDEEPLPPPPPTQRRTFILAGLGAAVLAVAGLEWLPRKAAIGNPPREQTAGTLLAFTAALFGHDLAADTEDAADLTDRLEILASVDSFPRDCAVLVHYLDELATKRGARSFTACSAAQKESIVGRLMAIEIGSLHARVLSRVSPGMREYYRMRWSTVPMLSWVYQHSAAAWRARGYPRWPGVAGDWRESLSRGTPYP